MLVVHYDIGNLRDWVNELIEHPDRYPSGGFELSCDECSATIKRDSVAATIIDAYCDGWRHCNDHDRDYCPKCKPQAKKKRFRAWDAPSVERALQLTHKHFRLPNGCHIPAVVLNRVPPYERIRNLTRNEKMFSYRQERQIYCEDAARLAGVRGYEWSALEAISVKALPYIPDVVVRKVANLIGCNTEDIRPKATEPPKRKRSKTTGPSKKKPHHDQQQRPLKKIIEFDRIHTIVITPKDKRTRKCVRNRRMYLYRQKHGLSQSQAARKASVQPACWISLETLNAKAMAKLPNPTIDRVAFTIGCPAEELMPLRERSVMQELHERNVSPHVAIKDPPVYTDPVLSVQLEEKRDCLNKMLSTLTLREREILEMRYGIGDGGPLTLAQVGTIVGLTKARVGVIEAHAVRKLQHPASKP